MVRMPFNFSFRRNKKKEKNDGGENCNTYRRDKGQVTFPSERRKMNHMTPADFRAKLDDNMEGSMKSCKHNQFFDSDQIFVHGVLILPEMNNTGTLMYAAKLKKFYNENVDGNDDDIVKALEKLEKTKEIFDDKPTSDYKATPSSNNYTLPNEKFSKNIFNSFPSQKYKNR
uniref:M-phase phosphoprotein 6 n=1 Tax=Parastrongyloides trichosuri TaxID=131310 RepID=A0A0N4ZTI9_PARTI